MATPLLPVSMIPPSQQNYSVQKATEFVQSEVDSGDPRTRADKFGASHIVQATWQCTPRQYTQLSGFFRDRLQGGVRIFRIPLLIDVPKLVNYRARLLTKREMLSQTQGLLHTISATLAVIPNPILSFDLICQSVSDNRVIAPGNADFQLTMAQFPIGRQVLLTGCEGTVNSTFLNLDGTYTILGKPIPEVITLTNAPVINPGWTTLNGTVAQALFPQDNAGACILLPE